MDEYRGISRGRWSGMTPNVMTLPKELQTPEFVEAVKNAVKVWTTTFSFAQKYFNNNPYATVFVDGDDVIYDQRHPATIKGTLPNGDFRIRFKDQTLIPPEMDVPMHMLEWDDELELAQDVNPDVMCPKCHELWKETQGFRFSYFDCPGCGMKKEDALAG